jgi:hypothetical protein
LEASTITLDFLNDTATGQSITDFASAWGTTVALTLKQTSDAVQVLLTRCIAPTVLVNNTTDINGAVGDISTQSITFTCNSPIVITTS